MMWRDQSWGNNHDIRKVGTSLGSPFCEFGHTAFARPLGIAVHDHLIVGKDGHASLKALKLI
jgi:hypothetical protein